MVAKEPRRGSLKFAGPQSWQQPSLDAQSSPLSLVSGGHTTSPSLEIAKCGSNTSVHFLDSKDFGMGWVISLQNAYVGVLTPSSSGCDLIWT